MAIAVAENLAIAYSGAGVTSLTRSFTISGSQRYLVVGILDVSGDSATSCTYGGVAMTQLAKINALTSRYIYVYGLANPTTGTNDIVYTRGSTTSVCGFGATNLSGATQTTSPIDTSATVNGTGGVATVSLTTTVDNCGVIVFGSGDANFAASTNLTEIAADAAFDLALLCRSTTFPKTPAGAQTYEMTTSTGNNGIIGVAIAPYVAATNTGSFFLVM